MIEVMACPGGCIGGGGQPYPPEGMKVLDPELLRLRASALYTIDSSKELRKSYENPAIEELYDKYLLRARLAQGPRIIAHALRGEIAARSAIDISLVM